MSRSVPVLPRNTALVTVLALLLALVAALPAGAATNPNPAWVVPGNLWAGHATPVTLEVTSGDGGTTWSQGASTVAITHDGVEVAGAVGTVTVVDPQQLDVELVTSLAAGQYAVEVTTSGDVESGELWVDEPYAFLSQSMFQPGYTAPVTVQVTGGGTTWDGTTTATAYEIDSGAEQVGAVTITNVTSATELDLRLDTSLPEAAYRIDFATGANVVSADLYVESPWAALLGTNEFFVGYPTQQVELLGSQTTWDGTTTIAVLDAGGVEQAGAATNLAVSSSTSLTFDLVEGLAAGEYQVEVATGGDVVSAGLWVAEPSAFADPASWFVETTLPLTVAIVGHGTTFDGTTTVGMVHVDSGTDATGAVDNIVVTDATSLTFDVVSQLAAGPYAVSLTTGGDVVTAEVWVEEPWVVSTPDQLLPGHPTPTTLTLHGGGTTWDQVDTTVLVHDGNDVEVPGATGNVVVSGVDEMTVDLVQSLPEGSYRAEVVTPRETVDFWFDVAAPGVRVTPSVWPLNVGYATPVEVWVDGWHTSFADGVTVVEVLDAAGSPIPGATDGVAVWSARYLSFNLTTDLDFGSHVVRVTTGGEVFEGTLDVDVPTVVATPDYLAPDYATPVTIDVVGSGTSWDGTTTVTLLDAAGDEVPGAIGAPTVSSPQTLSFDVTTTLPSGRYDAMIEDADDQQRAPIEVGAPYGWVTPPGLATGYATPQSLVVSGVGSHFDGTTTVALRNQVGDTVATGANVVVSSPTELSVDLVDQLPPGTYTIVVTTGDEVVEIFNFVVEDPSLYVWPETIEGGYRTPAPLELYGARTSWDATSTVRVLDDGGQPVVGAVNNRRVRDASRIDVDLAQVLPTGDYTVEVTTGSEVVATPFAVTPPSACRQALPAPGSGLTNMGFETGDLSGWTVGFTTSEGVAATMADGYETPFEGSWMARLGEAHASAAETQPIGVNELCQDFVVDQDVEAFAYSVFTYDWRGGDEAFTFDLVVSDPDTGEVLSSFEQQAWGADDRLKRTGWVGVELDLTGHVGETVRLTFRAETAYTDELPFWVYLDSAEAGLPVPPTPTAQTTTTSGSVMTDPDTGQVSVAMPFGNPSDLTLTVTPSCDGGATPDAVTILYGGGAYPATRSGGSWSATIPQADITNVGGGAVTMEIDCPGATAVTVAQLGEIVLYDPSGIISDAETGQPVVGATVHLYRVPGWFPKAHPGDTTPNTCESHASKGVDDPWSQPAPTGEGVLVDAASPMISPNVNPFITNGIGYYGWDVAEGCWYVVVSDPAYETLVSPVVGVPDEVTDLDLSITPHDVWGPTFADTTLGVADVTTTGARITWDAATDNRAVAGYRVVVDGAQVATTTSRAHHLTGLAPATSYLVEVIAYDEAGNDSTNGPSATITTSSDPSDGSVARLAGDDRFGTNVAVTTSQFGPDVPVVYVATARNFPDALAGGPVAARNGGAIVLVERDAIPPSVASELQRLTPQRIVILGGASAVSDAVGSALQAYTSGTVTRVAGANRYETAAQISADEFAPGVDVAYVATGGSFPDALAGGVAAHRDGGPVLLVTRDAVPTSTADELARLEPKRIVVLGGEGAVSAAVADGLAAFTDGAVDRLWGTNREATSAGIAATFTAPVDEVVVATGANFPDALSGVPVASLRGAPILLVGSAIDDAVAAQLRRLNPRTITILGGEGAVSAAVAAALTAYLR